GPPPPRRLPGRFGTVLRNSCRNSRFWPPRRRCCRDEHGAGSNRCPAMRHARGRFVLHYQFGGWFECKTAIPCGSPCHWAQSAESGNGFAPSVRVIICKKTVSDESLRLRI